MGFALPEKGKTMIPKEVSEKHMAICNKCKERRFYAKRFDMHFDWIDCWYDCPNDYEHWKDAERKDDE